MIKLAACVVLYNPDDTIFENILTYGNYVDKLIVIDNSLKKNNFLIVLYKSDTTVGIIESQNELRHYGIRNVVMTFLIPWCCIFLWDLAYNHQCIHLKNRRLHNISRCFKKFILQSQMRLQRFNHLHGASI